VPRDFKAGRAAPHDVTEIDAVVRAALTEIAET
jgi:hypothetical protein